MNSFCTRGRVTFTLLAFGSAALLLATANESPLLAQHSAASAQANPTAERDAIWNSASMLRARAWVKEYCDRSAKISKQEEKKYLAELAALSPTQMKLWLLKFDDEHQQLKQRQALWQQAHHAALSQAMAADKAAQSSMASISQGESASANLEQQRLKTLQAQANEASQEKRSELADDAAPWSPGYLGLFPGGYHVHYHLYP